MEREKEIRLTIDELEAVLKKAKLITSKGVVNRAWFEPGELIINVVR